jgi:hypothetical protein
LAGILTTKALSSIVVKIISMAGKLAVPMAMPVREVNLTRLRAEGRASIFVLEKGHQRHPCEKVRPVFVPVVCVV